MNRILTKFPLNTLLLTFWVEFTGKPKMNHALIMGTFASGKFHSGGQGGGQHRRIPKRSLECVWVAVVETGHVLSLLFT